MGVRTTKKSTIGILQLTQFLDHFDLLIFLHVLVLSNEFSFLLLIPFVPMRHMLVILSSSLLMRIGSAIFNHRHDYHYHLMRCAITGGLIMISGFLFMVMPGLGGEHLILAIAWTTPLMKTLK
jgi:hypothetical protein